MARVAAAERHFTPVRRGAGMLALGRLRTGQRNKTEQAYEETLKRRTLPVPVRRGAARRAKNGAWEVEVFE